MDGERAAWCGGPFLWLVHVRVFAPIVAYAMAFSSTKLYSVLTFPCPHGHEGRFFQSHPYDLSRAGDILKHRPQCGRSYEMEPGFYYGAIYVAYGVGVGICLITFLMLRLLVPRLPLYWIIIVMAGVMIFGGPYFYALNKIIWANIFIGYKKPEVRP